MVKVAPNYQCCSCEAVQQEQTLRLLLRESLAQTRARWGCRDSSNVFLCLGRSCWFWLARRIQTLPRFESTCSEKEQVSRRGNALHHSLTWLVLPAFSLRGFNQGVLCRLNRFTTHTAMSHFTTREFGLNTQSLGRVLHLNYLSGSSGCRCLCPPYPHSSIKGIFTFAGSWFLRERPRLRLTITKLSDSTL